MGRRNSIVSAALVACVSISSGTTVYAESTSDLYKVYGVKDTTASALQKEKVDSLMDDYNDKSQEYNYAVEYNTILEKLDLESLQQQYADLTEELCEKKEYINLNGIDMSYSELRESMSEYKRKSAELSELGSLIEKYSEVEEKEVPDYDFDSLAKELVDAKDECDTLKAEADIGDVSNLYNFLQASYTVKRKFDGTGLLLKALPNTGVLSVFNGTVVYSERNEVTGETIKIDSGDGIIITYRGLTARYVQTDDTVTQYQKIATTGENLYITLEINGEYYDLNKLYGG